MKLAAATKGAKAFELYGNLSEIYYPMRPGSLGKRSSRPKQLNVRGKTSTESLTTKLLQHLGLLHGVCHIPPTAGIQT